VRFGQWIGFFLVIISFYIVWQIRQILLIVFAAIVLATVLNNFVTFRTYATGTNSRRGVAVAHDNLNQTKHIGILGRFSC
jgi:predicted PurR-regulated permease PerM